MQRCPPQTFVNAALTTDMTVRPSARECVELLQQLLWPVEAADKDTRNGLLHQRVARTNEEMREQRGADVPQFQSMEQELRCRALCARLRKHDDYIREHAPKPGPTPTQG